jgi:hypothetical protein
MFTILIFTFSGGWVKIAFPLPFVIADRAKNAVCLRREVRLMEIILTANIPDDVAAAIQNGSTTPLPRRLLELAAIQAHLADLITEQEVMEMLGFDDEEDLYLFFKQYDVRSKYTMEDLEKDRATLAAILDK